MIKLNLQLFALKRPTPPGGGGQAPSQNQGQNQQQAPLQNQQQAPLQNQQQAPLQNQQQAPLQNQQQAPLQNQQQALVQNQQQAPANVNQTPQTNGSGAIAMMDFHNQGGDVVLEGFDEWTGSNYVTIDGSDFYIKSSESRLRDLTVVLSYARQYYKWFDKDNNKWHESPTKVDNRYSLAAELKWFDWVEGEDEAKEFTMSIATTSTMVFRDYVKSLRDGGIRLNAIWTRMTIERLERIDPETKEKQRYSRLILNNAGPVVYEQQA